MRMAALVLPLWPSSDKKRIDRCILEWKKIFWHLCLSGYAFRLPTICGCQINYFMWLMWLCGCCGWKSILLYVCLSPNFPLCIQVGEAWCTKSGKKTGSPPTSSAPYMTFCLWPWVKSNLMFVIFSHSRNLKYAKYAFLCAYLGAPNMVKWGVPEKILHNAVWTRWS